MAVLGYTILSKDGTQTTYENNKSCKNLGLSPNGKATDSDSVISRFESL